jgi:1-acyl-sn-glycerol-3-phosphate acyltransferase
MTRPNPLPVVSRWRTNLLQAPAFGIATAFFGSLSLAASLIEKDGRWQHRIAQTWAEVSVRISLSPLTVIGEKNLKKYAVAVYAANHTSYMDTPVIFSSLPFQFRILARKELWQIPFIGWHLRRSGQIPIDTTNPRASIASLSGGVRALKAGMPLFVFPEGGRTKTGHPGDFLGGAAYLAIKAQVPLVPMALAGVYELLPIHTRHFHPRPLTLAIGEPIDTTGYTLKQVEELTNRLRDEISRLYYQYASLTPPEENPTEPEPATQKL